MSTRLLLAAALAAGLLTLTLHAEEAGSGHYMPGGSASFIDALPGKPALVIALVMVLFTLSETGENERLPLITIPAQ